MTAIRCVVFLVLLTFQWTLTGGDSEVSCTFMERCVLPCRYSGPDVVIHWHQVSAGHLLVHTFYENKDQLALQDQRFRNRTSLFQDQLSQGNASLQLTGVKVQDEGRYSCYTSTHSGAHESFINLKIRAPVHKVNIQQAGNRITCSSEGIYPEPELTWSTSPPSNITSNTTTEQQPEHHLYSISSSLILSDGGAEVAYSCTISTHRSRKRATLFKPASVLLSDPETTIPCPPSHSPVSNLVWRFNHRQKIVSRSGADSSYAVYAGWEQHVKFVSESGSLTLQDLTSEHEGIFTCELSDAEDTKISDVRMLAGSNGNDPTLHPANVGAIVGGLLVIVVVVVVVVVVARILNKKNSLRQRPRSL